MKLNRDQIKFIAIITMTFNHIAHGLMTSGTLLYEVFEDIGYFTADYSDTLLWRGVFMPENRLDTQFSVEGEAVLRYNNKRLCGGNI